MNKQQVSPRQIELLLDFMDQHRTLAVGRVRGKEGNALSKRLWQQCTEILNSEFNGAHKTANEWKKYYNQYKSRVKAKLRSIKQGVTGTGGGPASTTAITPLEERLYGILGGCCSPLPVRHNPLDASVSSNNAHATDDDIIAVDNGHSFARQMDSESYEDITVEPGQFIVVRNNENEDAEMDRNILNNTPINPDYADDTIEQTVRMDVEERTHRKNKEKPRKRRQARMVSPNVHTEFEEAGQRLAAMEQSRIDVDKALVCATNRQAAAIEGLVGQIKCLVDLYAQNLQNHPTEVTRQEIRISSSSDVE